MRTAERRGLRAAADLAGLRGGVAGPGCTGRGRKEHGVDPGCTSRGREERGAELGSRRPLHQLRLHQLGLHQLGLHQLRLQQRGPRATTVSATLEKRGDSKICFRRKNETK